MIQRDNIIGHRITAVLGDSSLSDKSINFCDFLYRTDNGQCFRMPGDDNSGELLASVEVTNSYERLNWPRESEAHYKRNLWNAAIVDILVPADPEKRYPDSGLIALSSGWYIMQYSCAPIGVLPFVSITQQSERGQPMTSVWDLNDISSPGRGRDS